MKPSVAGIPQYLMEDSNTSSVCSDFVMDILDVILDDMLRMDPDHRKDCAEILEKLVRISRTCSEDSNYWNKLRKPLSKRTSQHSWLISSRKVMRHRRQRAVSVQSSSSSKNSGAEDISAVNETTPLLGRNDSISAR